MSVDKIFNYIKFGYQVLKDGVLGVQFLFKWFQGNQEETEENPMPGGTPWTPQEVEALVGIFLFKMAEESEKAKMEQREAEKVQVDWKNYSHVFKNHGERGVGEKFKQIVAKAKKR